MNEEVESNKNQEGEGSADSQESSSSIIPDEILNAIPEEERKDFLKSVTSISGVFPQQNPLMKKITSEHITALISNSNEVDKRDRDERKGERFYNYLKHKLKLYKLCRFNLLN